MKDAVKIAAVTLAGLFTAVFLYPFLHEGGHLLAAVIVGAEVKEFHLFPLPNILCDVHTGNIPGLILIGLHGILFPFLLVCVVRPKKFWLWHLALEYGCKSIAFPLISSGVYGYPKDQVLKVAVDCITAFLTEHDMLAYIVVFD